MTSLTPLIDCVEVVVPGVRVRSREAASQKLRQFVVKAGARQPETSSGKLRWHVPRFDREAHRTFSAHGGKGRRADCANSAREIEVKHGHHLQGTQPAKP